MIEKSPNNTPALNVCWSYVYDKSELKLSKTYASVIHWSQTNDGFSFQNVRIFNEFYFIDTFETYIFVPIHLFKNY